MIGGPAQQPRGATQRKPSITDVARLAGVSYQTVSRVINNASDVSPETRQRILDVIEEVGYRRNRMATALVTNRSTGIGIVTSDSPRLGPIGTLVALEKEARLKGYGTAVVTVEEPYEGSVEHALETLEDAGVAGVVVIAPLVSMAAAVWNARVRVPVEMIAAGVSSTPEVVTYSENQELGARLATQHLIDLGHTDIAHLGGALEWFDAQSRRRGWEGALQDAGLSPGLYLEGDWSPRWAYETTLRLIDEGRLPEAVFAVSDHTALGLIRAVAERGLRVPEDISVVGFDDVEGSDYFRPPLTTVRQDFPALARSSLEVLLAAIEGRAVSRSPSSPTLIVRESAAPRAQRG
ncbi:LacI family DNA-binding transcriptional regulator [Amnibacterium sp. CER49]|uniref:LacI family DNA-binding transcriptional regulator n=1 Tax=Amnibacterium sp. CER49 TaxID=3039161 RepID=UPI00244B9443|nr:LacI family DNA-binding transcriptional regulator [Amnibacterium sp. CER49]MDH2444842.1 LacI family DNA-binding transcriptional regulator [Amnibacterium sp. CER49]